MAQLWGGRFQGETDRLAYEFNASINFDKRLYREDITGSIAHAKMLAKQGIISIDEADVLCDALAGILGDIAADNQSSQQNALSTLRYLNPILLAGVTLFGYMSMFLSEYFALIAAAVGIVALAAAIWTAVTLFRLRREVSVQSH